MRTGKRENNKNFWFNNNGTSLVELLIVIAIMSILTGGIALGVSLVFSKDAESCATKLNDALTTARMYSMSKEGKYSIKISGSATDRYIAEIIDSASGSETVVETIYLEDSSGGNKISSITPSFSLYDGAGTTEPSLDIPLTIKFDRSKGCVIYAGGDIEDSVNAVIKFEIEAARAAESRKKAYVNLVVGTGRHSVGDL